MLYGKLVEMTGSLGGFSLPTPTPAGVSSKTLPSLPPHLRQRDGASGHYSAASVVSHRQTTPRTSTLAFLAVAHSRGHSQTPVSSSSVRRYCTLGSLLVCLNPTFLPCPLASRR